MRGEPKKLVEAEAAEVTVTTHAVDSGAHTVIFNRGVAGSQAYARKFGERKPDEVGPEAFEWLSRGLVEALLGYLGQATDARFGLRAALYEFQYEPVLKAFGAARDRGADVRVIFDGRHNKEDVPSRANRAAVDAAGIGDIASPREANPNFISHNKFVVLLRDGHPAAVWTGSTNITRGGIYGHSNVGHIVRDPDVAAAYLRYWERLAADPQALALRPANEADSPLPAGPPPVGTITPVFSPRPDLSALEWYRDRMENARTGVFLTAAFGVNDLFAQVLGQDRDYLRYVLLERAGGNIQLIRRDPDNQIAVGATIGGGLLEDWLNETTTGLNTHVRFIHTKYMLIDPLTDDPLVITGSANFSDASTKENDENMVVIRGDTDVADMYLGEFMRLFRHFYFRDFVNRHRAAAHLAAAVRPAGLHLTPTDAWAPAFYVTGSIRAKERVAFAGPRL
jgi:phosphatidylserine/phosphatidylglycerophosphate/cardiolipin synthase-like enzyme